MNQYTSLEKQVIEEITPTQSDRKQLQKTISILTTTVQDKLKEKQQKASVELVGSTAKDTFLKNKLDIDLFIIFDSTVFEETIADTTLSIGREILDDTEECYAEHPYIRGNFLKYKVELVPCYQITDASEKISAVDRTPFHTRYVKNHLQNHQKKEVRLLKQFLTGIRCYGAEAEIQGFSGYLCELLIIKYDQFHQLIEDASTWEEGIQLTLTAYPIPEFDDPLIFIDPVDKERNVAAAVSPRSFHRFVTACNAYLKKPKKTFFFPKAIIPWSLDTIKKKLEDEHGQFIGIQFKKPQIINENLYPQLRKACNAIKNESHQYDFIIYDIQFYVDTSSNMVFIIIKTDEAPLTETYIHMGPPVHLEKNTQQFVDKWKNHPATIEPPFQHKNRTYVTVKRKYRYLDHFLQDNLTELSLGKHLDPIIKHHHKILSQKELLLPELTTFWTDYLDDKKPWER